MKQIVGIFAEMGAGKDTAADYLIKKYGFKKISYSENLLKPLMSSVNAELKRENFINLGKAMKSLQPAVLSYLAYGFILKSKDEKFVLPNLMTIEEVEFFKKIKDIDFTALKITTNAEKRFDRWVLRNRDIDNVKKDFNEFKEKDTRNTEETRLKELLESGLEDFSISNDSTFDEFYKKIDEFVKVLKI